jgi:dipeptidase E
LRWLAWQRDHVDGTIFLGGGGSETDEDLLWNELFAAGKRVVVWPFAHRRVEDQRATGQWLSSALATRAFQVETWLDDVGRHIDQLEGADVLAILGGNTFDLLAYLQRRDWFAGLRDSLTQGGRLYGGSAGAILLGADVAIAAAMDPMRPRSPTLAGWTCSRCRRPRPARAVIGSGSRP